MRKYSYIYIPVIVLALCLAFLQIPYPVDAQVNAIDFSTDYSVKIDNEAVLGLLGTEDSLAYKVHEIEKHFHSAASWFEAAGTATGTHFADRIGTSGGGGPFIADAGNDDWGTWLQILGADDTPARADQVKFDPHEIVISATERVATYFVQMTRGATGAAGLSAGTYTEFVYSADANRYTGIIKVQTGRAPVDSLLWLRCLCPGQNTATMSFYIGIHEYPG